MKDRGKERSGRKTRNKTLLDGIKEREDTRN
jgi:hypothetical protein